MAAPDPHHPAIRALPPSSDFTVTAEFPISLRTIARRAIADGLTADTDPRHLAARLTDLINAQAADNVFDVGGWTLTGHDLDVASAVQAIIDALAAATPGRETPDGRPIIQPTPGQLDVFGGEVQ